MIRLASPTDIARISEILIFSKRKTYRNIFQNDQVSFNQMTVLNCILDYQNKKNSLENVYVYDDGIVKGMMKWKFHELKNKWEMKEIYVDPFFQNEGIGSNLMNYFIREAKKEGIEKVCLWVLEENKQARIFYENYQYIYANKQKIVPNTNKYLFLYERNL
ncbi:GNAT family N-acetyltransferase [Enterococcus faecalis]|uniref:GNAT family N-acetyltransferase n=1 Tax=Enterococcus faecalis TaxID=1351 RepID=UPI0001F0D178|nr:GNAT family N-acetyltransferase [Enterococcus faecalis]EFT95514.1 acetyltransferase, GNAT family [Enterococcus faecalis TX0012]